jgi:hypothetical protein
MYTFFFLKNMRFSALTASVAFSIFSTPIVVPAPAGANIGFSQKGKCFGENGEKTTTLSPANCLQLLQAMSRIQSVWGENTPNQDLVEYNADSDSFVLWDENKDLFIFWTAPSNPDGLTVAVFIGNDRVFFKLQDNDLVVVQKGNKIAIKTILEQLSKIEATYQQQ